MPKVNDCDSELADKDVVGSDVAVKNIDAMNGLQSSEGCFTVEIKMSSRMQTCVKKLTAETLPKPVHVWFRVEHLHLA